MIERAAREPAAWGAPVLIGYQWAIYALLASMFAEFSVASLWLQIFYLWVGCILGGRLEAIQHWGVHYPPLRGRLARLLYRLSFCVTPEPVALYRRMHLDHHRQTTARWTGARRSMATAT